jgi:hypothetical protein
MNPTMAADSARRRLLPAQVELFDGVGGVIVGVGDATFDRQAIRPVVVTPLVMLLAAFFNVRSHRLARSHRLPRPRSKEEHSARERRKKWTSARVPSQVEPQPSQSISVATFLSESEKLAVQCR